MRHQTKVLGDKLQPFLGLIEHMFDQIDLVVRDQLDNQARRSLTHGMSLPKSSQTHDNSPRSGSSTASISDIELGQPTLSLPKAMASLKVLGECPIIIQSILEVYQSSESLDINLIFLRIKSILLLQAKPQEQAHAAAAKKGTIFTGVSPNIGNREAFGEFIGTQVKAVSRLAYLLRISEEQLTKLTEFNDFLPTLPDIVIRLLKDCPREKSAVRKELLVATRHIINFNFRRIFLKQIDQLLDERILLGDGLTVYETQRPLAYSMLADLIHHVRDALEPPQIRKTVEVYTKNLQDNFPGTSFQTMSAKLLLNMTECIAKIPNKVDARYYLFLILNAIGNKFAAIKQQYSNAVKLSKLYAQLSNDVSSHNYLADKETLPDWDEIDIFAATPIKTSNPLDRGADPVADNKFLLRNLINGLKGIFHQLKVCQIGSSIGFTAEEVQVISKLFREGAQVFCYYTTDRPAAESQYISALQVMIDCYISGTKEGMDLLETFLAVLCHIDPTTLHEIFHDQIQVALGRSPQLSMILPTLVQQYDQMNYLEDLFNIHAESWFDLLIWSVLDIEKGVHKSRTSSIRVALRKNLMGPVQEIWLAATSCARMEPSYERIDNEWLDEKEARITQNTESRPAPRKSLSALSRENSFTVPSSLCIKTSIHHEVLDLEKRVLETRNSPFRAAVCKSLILPVQRLSFAATSWFCVEPSVKAIINAMLHVKKGVLKTRNDSFRAALCKSLIRLFQKICVEATSGLCLEPSVKIIIDAVLDVEEGIQRTQNSTFRATLYKYWNRFPQEVWSFLSSKIKELKYGRFLAQILEHPEGGPLRKIAVKNIGILIKFSGDMEAVQDTWYTTVINTIHIMHSLCKFKGTEEWMDGKDNIIWFKRVGESLESYLRANTLSLQLRLAAEQASEQLMVVFSKFLEHHPTDLDALFSLVEFVADDDFRQTHSLLTYIYRCIICNGSIEYQKMIVLHSLEVYAGKRASQRTKTFLLHNIVNPIVAMDVMRLSKERSPKNSRLIDETVITSIHSKIWKVGFGDPNDDLTGIDHTRLEALQLTATLVKYHHSVLQDARKDIIKFGWTHIRLEDVINKHAAYVVTGYCIAHYETPANVVQRVYLSLLKTNQDAGPALVTQALELIATTFPNKCNAVPDDPNSVWAVTPHRILTEERQHVQQITTVFSFLVKHADFFYKYRDKFITLIVKSLRAIAPLPNCSGQSKKLVLQLMTLVWQWEQQRVKGLTSEEHKLQNLGGQLIISSSLSVIYSSLADMFEYEIPDWARAEMVTYLLEFIVSLRRPSPPPRANAEVVTASLPPSAEMINSMSILHSLLQPQYWGGVDTDLSKISEILLAGDPTDNKWVDSMTNTLQVVRVITDVTPHILESTPLLGKLLEMSQKSDNSEFCACLYDEADIIGLKMKSLWSRGLNVGLWRDDDVSRDR
jgi:hypothetical protein